MASTREKVDEASARFNRRIADIVARGNTRPGHDSTVTIRFVDPETIRPPGWKPTKPLPKNASMKLRKQAIVELLDQRGPTTKSDIRKLLDINSIPLAKILDSLEDGGHIVYGEEVVGAGGGRASRLVELVDIGEILDDVQPPAPAPEMESPTEEEAVSGLAAQHQARQDDQPTTGPTNVQRAIRVLEEEGPMRQADLRDKLGISSGAMATTVVGGLRKRGVQFGEPVDRSPMLSLPGQEPPAPPRTETWVCASCGEDITPEQESTNSIGVDGAREHIECPTSDSAATDEVEESEAEDPREEPQPTPAAPDAPEPAPAAGSSEEEPPAEQPLRQHGATTLEFETPLHEEYMEMLRGLLEASGGEAWERLRARYVRRLMQYAADTDSSEDRDRFLDEIEAWL